MSLTILEGDALAMLKTLPEQSVDCIVTSPPFFGLRDYHVAGQIGLEVTPEEYVEKLVAVFDEARRVLRNDGTCWIELGDAYWGSWQNYGGGDRGAGKQRLIVKGSQAQNPVWEGLEGYRPSATRKHPTLKPKDLMGIPWRVAFALQATGWYLRSDIVWHKANAMPESVRDRPTKAHSYIFMLSKAERYFYDAKAIEEQASGNAKAPGTNSRIYQDRDPQHSTARKEDFSATMRNKRSVWTVATKGFKGAHFATFPPELIKPCVLAGCPAGGTVLDPFLGSGTTGAVALALGRRCVGIELNPEYAALARERCSAANLLESKTSSEKQSAKERT